MKRLFCVVLALSLCTFAGAKPQATFPNGTTAPAPGSAERKAILDVLRPPISKEYGQTVVFYDVTLRVKNGWAYVSAYARDRRGKKMNRFASFIDPSTEALLQEKAGKWRVSSWGIATDASPLGEMRHKFPRAPRSIFPSMRDDFPGDGPEGGDGFNNRD